MISGATTVVTDLARYRTHAVLISTIVRPAAAGFAHSRQRSVGGMSRTFARRPSVILTGARCAAGVCVRDGISAPAGSRWPALMGGGLGSGEVIRGGYQLCDTVRQAMRRAFGSGRQRRR